MDSVERPVRTTSPGVSARTVIESPSTPSASKEMAVSVHVPLAIVTVSPGCEAAMAVASSAAVVT